MAAIFVAIAANEQVRAKIVSRQKNVCGGLKSPILISTVSIVLFVIYIPLPLFSS